MKGYRCVDGHSSFWSFRSGYDRLHLGAFLFLKKGHRGAAALKVACQMMRDKELKSVCQDQTRRYLYQIDNPVMGLMFDEG